LKEERTILLKVCGMKFPENIREIVQLQPDFLGFIFYPKSPRYVVEELDPQELSNIPDTIKKVGVFVNEELERLLDLANQYQLDMIQLHGEETPEYCQKVRDEFPVIKAFSVGNHLDLDHLKEYEKFVDYFLFDTKTPLYGGSGKKFNWDELNNYNLDKPYFLSGGIGVDDIEHILNREFPGTLILDVNSKMESEPGRKDVLMVRALVNKLKQKVL